MYQNVTHLNMKSVEEIEDESDYSTLKNMFVAETCEADISSIQEYGIMVSYELLKYSYHSR